jgi:predicted RNA binding protein YcfA (HicA-like mRNA interferase family)
LRRTGSPFDRQSGSHRQYERVSAAGTHVVTVAYHNINDLVRPDTLASMIRQSGLPKSCSASEPPRGALSASDSHPYLFRHDGTEHQVRAASASCSSA